MEAVRVYKSNWWGFIGKRVLIAAVAFFVISFMIFCRTDYITNMDRSGTIIDYGYLTEAQRNEYFNKYHLNYGTVVRYFFWLGDFVTGDWGYSSQDYSWLTESK